MYPLLFLVAGREGNYLFLELLITDETAIGWERQELVTVEGS